MTRRLTPLFLWFALVGYGHLLSGQSPEVVIKAQDKQQVIDGFGAFQDGSLTQEEWVKDLYLDDLRASIYRVDIVPRFVAPYSDLRVYSPWFMGGGTDSPFNLEDPDNPNGPEGNRARTYTGPEDYSRDYAGRNAPIAIMGPDIDVNKTLFVYPDNELLEEGVNGAESASDFKLIASMWSPAPWLKISSGNSWNQNWFPGPVQGTPWPFVWGGNYAGGMLDVSDTPLTVFDDSGLGGSGPTSALTQFARGLAAYLRGYQENYGVKFYAISIQNELNFEQYYNSATYPLSSQYIKALKAARAELDRYDDLRDIRIMGPEDLLGNDAYGMWQYGGGEDVTHKNLQYLRNIAADSAAQAAIDFYCIHGYARDGISAAGATSVSWDWWANGWEASPAAGIPDNIAGFTDYGKKSWMTETSGENKSWLYPAAGYPGQGAWSLALRIHQALTTGRQSAWIYWTFVDGDDEDQPTDFGLTTESTKSTSGKYVAAKHFFRYIRPDAYRVTTTSSEATLYSSAYLHEADASITIVLINGEATAVTPILSLEGIATKGKTFDAYTSDADTRWAASTISPEENSMEVTIPAYGIVTLTSSGISTATHDPEDLAFTASLGDVVPNPARDLTQITVNMPKAANAELTLHDAAGRLLATLHSGRLEEGSHQFETRLERLPVGSYVYHLRTPDGMVSKQFIKQ